MVRDETLSLRIMFLCFATATLVIAVQWHYGSFRDAVQAFQPRLARTPKPMRLPQPSPTSDARLVVDLSDRQVSLYRKNRLVNRYPIAVGQPGWETPTGSFKVFHLKRNPTWRHPITGQIVPPGIDNPLGDRWIGFQLGERTEIGFHGTNQEELIGQAVSHGCIRMRNHDIREMFDQINLGTPVAVQP
jgi:L,D-transpeptidase ErfK/SrfK